MHKQAKKQMKEILSTLTFTQALLLSASLNKDVYQASALLQTFPKGEMGLTPDDVKNSVAFKAAKLAFDTAFQNLRNFNQVYTKQFKSELAQQKAERWKV